MLYILIKESYAMHSCLYNEYIIHILNAKGRKQKNCVPHQECWKSQEACCSCWSKQNTPLGTNSPCFLCFVPSFPLICLKVFTSCYRDKRNDHWVVTAGQHKMSRSRKTDMALTLVTDTDFSVSPSPLGTDFDWVWLGWGWALGVWGFGTGLDKNQISNEEQWVQYRQEIGDI